nr:immunoglobulin light chain junction region [Macaca mulatta]MPN79712.1 immunoglobulin light chain junction region [Macaca mulatta]MPN79727.1 immunoglobulin light chain junction region [Macaca mulatta]MPN79844.1 immunoglobulin light chain junction region [Macaca mulatta]MPN79856.1 immunoglobulin light chain junction region [Macaca mulatta]
CAAWDDSLSSGLF